MPSATTTTPFDTHVITRAEWQARANSYRTQSEELVKLWCLNSFGSLNQCAEGMGVSRDTVQRHAKALVSKGKLTLEQARVKAVTAPHTPTVKEVTPAQPPTVKSRPKCATPSKPALVSVATNKSIEKGFIPQEDLPPGIVAASVDSDPEFLEMISVLTQIYDATLQRSADPESSWGYSQWRQLESITNLLHYQAERTANVHGRQEGRT